MKRSKHLTIKNKNDRERFIFCRILVEDVKEIKKLSFKKAAQTYEIPAKILKQNTSIFGDYICMFFNECIGQSNFPFVLKHENITPAFKKGYRGSKDDYHPVSILTIICKISEKLLCKQITLFME